MLMVQAGISRGEETPLLLAKVAPYGVGRGGGTAPMFLLLCVASHEVMKKEKREQISEESNAQRSYSCVLLTWRTPVPSSPVLQLVIGREGYCCVRQKHASATTMRWLVRKRDSTGIAFTLYTTTKTLFSMSFLVAASVPDMNCMIQKIKYILCSGSIRKINF
jgi:hypothetical protein